MNPMKQPFSMSGVPEEFSLESIRKVQQFQSSHERYQKTPLAKLDSLAEHLGVQEIFVKDESYRFGLNAFKVLGGIYAVGKYLAELLDRDIESLTFEELKSPETKKVTGEITFISATDGNHGRGIAWAAKELGHHSIIYMPKGSSERRLQAIKGEGAYAEITDFNYDAAVRYSSSLADQNGWVLIQDTAWEGYEKIPQWIMQGYATLAKESIEQIELHTEEPPTHVFLQCGVGSYAAGITGYLLQYYQEHHPKVIAVEPHSANCYYRSFQEADNSRHIVDGDMDTIMDGLACGEPNPLSWKILKRFAEASFSCDDKISALGMRILGNPLQEDPKVISGESGAVTTGLLYCLLSEDGLQGMKEKLQLDEHSRVLLISTEGDTDKESYRKIVWEGEHPLV
ncbi:diaminopropionate ammonia-lyase [Pontibacillus yanchengensis]|uniref:Diaminopropionate ammonia-lyase n=3 Tax=Pontibacillus yanchengensis TaxID=462910 RepID=A0ACC7VFR5_9BACI|nr:diaminopropionate ammonia-lyase [Pontibacillus yanchengensis]MYL53798.1 diaminopropionate ammonia-lyase [Pontibacillus yanchengensis]